MMCSRVSSVRPRVASGFSLVELLVVVTIMAILATVGMPLAELARRRTQEEELRRSLREIRSAIDQYKRLSDAGNIPRSADASGYPPNLQALVVGIVDIKSLGGTKIYLLRHLPRDPFAAPSSSPPDTWDLRSYASSAEDPKAGADVFDVHSRSAGTGLNGVPYRQW